VHHREERQRIRGDCHSNGGGAGLVAAVKLARVGSREIESRSLGSVRQFRIRLRLLTGGRGEQMQEMSWLLTWFYVLKEGAR
jgi:hypothetical protein